MKQIRPGYYAMYNPIAKGITEINAHTYVNTINQEVDLKNAQSLAFWADKDLILEGTNSVKLAKELLTAQKDASRRITLRFDLEEAVALARETKADALIMVCEHGLYHNGQLIHLVPFIDATVKQFATEEQNDHYMRKILDTAKELPMPVFIIEGKTEGPLRYLSLLDHVSKGTFVCASK